jgi:hypothetical protein
MSLLRLWQLTDCTTNYRPILSSERAPQDEGQSNCPGKERKKKNLVMGPKGVPDIKMDRPTDRRSQHQLDTHQYLNSGSPRDTCNWEAVFYGLSLELGGECLSRNCDSIVYMCRAATFAAAPPGRQLWEVKLGAHCLEKTTHWDLRHLWAPTTEH